MDEHTKNWVDEHPNDFPEILRWAQPSEMKGLHNVGLYPGLGLTFTGIGAP
jgi:hypothetical protein